MKTLFIACDHAGYALKEKLKTLRKDLPWTDLGTHSAASVDYPDFADRLAQAMKNKFDALGVAICGSGIGISIALNRHAHIRAALCESVTTAKLAREHNDANVLALGARILDEDQALEILETFLSAQLESNERHMRRIEKLSNKGQKE